MSRPEDHLIRAEADDGPGVRELGLLTGLSRLAIDQHRLEGLAVLRLSSGRERFIYVQQGHGTIDLLPAGSKPSAAAPISLQRGDFVSLMPDESAAISAAAEGLLLTIGSGPGEIPSDSAYAREDARN